jgi:hypothetical protein
MIFLSFFLTLYSIAKIQSEKVSKLPPARQLRLSTSKLRLSSDLWWTKNNTFAFYFKP